MKRGEPRELHVHPNFQKHFTRNLCSIKIFIVGLLEFKAEWFAFQKLKQFLETFPEIFQGNMYTI